jgi:uroporphyrin-3 C-methyltransferase
MTVPAPDSTVPVAAGRAAPLLRIVCGLLGLIAVLALFLVIQLGQKVSGMQEQLARQSADATAQAAEARALARQAQDTVRDSAARLTLLESRVAEVALQRAQLEDLIQNLSRSRDDNLVADIDAALRLAQQQTQLTGNTQPLLAALQTGVQRIDPIAQPRLALLQQAMQHDADRLRASASGDNGAALAQLDELMRGVDELPTVNALHARVSGGSAGGPQAIPADARWWDRWLLSTANELRSLVRVSRIDQPEAVLLAPDQTYFLRENLKLKLLSVRLAMLSRQPDRARGELAGVASALNRYFDPASRRVQQAATELQQLQGLVKTAEPPRIDETLAALATAAAGR